MIADLPAYPTLRDSGEAWLGHVPDHWPTFRLKAVVRNVVEPSHAEGNDLRVALENVESWTGRFVPGRSESFEGSAKRFEAGDVLFGKLRPYLAKVTRLDVGGSCVGEFLVLRPSRSKAQGAYLEHLLRSQPVIDMINSSTFGAKMPRAEWQFIGSLRIPLPSDAEQAAIVRFLRHTNQWIRRHVRAKQTLIKTLAEQQQAIIHRAVTRGLDRNIPLAHSGIDWLGDIPAHWQSKRAKFFFREIDERSLTGLEELLSVSHITGVTPRSEKNVTMFEPESYVGHKVCQDGDLVINTMWAWAGALGITRREGIVSPSYGVYKPLRRGDFAPEFIDAMLRSPSYVAQYYVRSTGIRKSRLRLYPEEFLRIPLLQPPIEEQHAIVSSFTADTEAIRNAISGVQREVELLLQLQRRLIADVVTGKLDVREIAGRLPEAEPEEPQIDMAPEPGDSIDDDLEEVEV